MSHLRRDTLAIVFLASFVGSGRAAAQDVASATPDVVETLNGDFYRGTIVESVPGDHVTILLPSGASITVAWSELTRADRNVDRPTSGAAQPEPTPAAPIPPPAAMPAPRATAPAVPSGDFEAGALGPYGEPLPPGERVVSVRVQTANPRQTLQLLVGKNLTRVSTGEEIRIPLVIPNSVPQFHHVSVASPIFRPVCEDSCSLRLGVGLTYTFNVDPGDDALRIGRPRSVRITERTVGLRIDHRSRRVHRRAGWIANAGLLVLGGALTGLSYPFHERACERGLGRCDYGTRSQPMFWSGVVLSCLPMALIHWPLFQRDDSIVEVIESGRR